MPFKRLFWSKTTSLHGIFSRSDNYERKVASPTSKARRGSSESRRDESSAERQDKLDIKDSARGPNDTKLQVAENSQEGSLPDPGSLTKNHENSQSFNKDSFNLTQAKNYMAYRQDFHFFIGPGAHSSDVAEILSRSPTEYAVESSEDFLLTPRAGPSRYPTMPETPRGQKAPASVATSQRTARGRRRCGLVNISLNEIASDLPRDIKSYMKVAPQLAKTPRIIFLFRPTPQVSYSKKRRYPPISVGDIGFFDSDGGFDTQFNILDDAKNKEADYETPEGFIDFNQCLKDAQQSTGDYLIYQKAALKPQTALYGMKASKGTENTTQYEVLGPLSSCLCLPRGAELVSFRQNRYLILFEDFISRQGVLWTDFLKPRGIGKTKLNPVCVITTVYLTTSCAIALSETAKPGSTVTLARSGSDPEVLRWEDPCAEIKTYVSPPSESNPEDVTLARPTECIAVGGYKLDPPGQLIQSMTDIRQGVRNSVSRGGYMASMFERF